MRKPELSHVLKDEQLPRGGISISVPSPTRRRRVLPLCNSESVLKDSEAKYEIGGADSLPQDSGVMEINVKVRIELLSALK